MAHLDKHKLISARQHVCFFFKNSCGNQMTTVINDWVYILDSKGQMDTFTMDFEKAFEIDQNNRCVSTSAPNPDFCGKPAFLLPFKIKKKKSIIFPNILKSIVKLLFSYNVLKRVSFGSKDCTKELKLECAHFLGQTS